MSRTPIVMLSAFMLLISAATVSAEIVSIDGTVKSVDAKKRMIKVTTSTKEMTLDVGSKAKINVDGKEAELKEVAEGQKVILSFHDQLEVVVRIEASLESNFPIQFREADDQCEILLHGKPLANYIFRAPDVRFPFLANVNTAGGLPVIRRYPPGRNDNDHIATQPGIWVGFGDINGVNFTGEGAVRHLRITGPPVTNSSGGILITENAYENNGQIVCKERRMLSFLVDADGVLLIWDSEFSSPDHEFHFGDEKEMGFGLRVCRDLKADNGGKMMDSNRRFGEKGIWGKQAAWCQCTGRIDDSEVTLTMMPDPDNFRQSWLHVRGYGLMVANPFGEFAFTGRNRSTQHVKVGETFRIRFGVHIAENPRGQGPRGEDLFKQFESVLAK